MSIDDFFEFVKPKRTCYFNDISKVAFVFSKTEKEKCGANYADVVGPDADFQ